MSPRRYAELLGGVAFRRFWIGFTLSVLGDAITRVAFTWFVYEKTRSASALAVLMICYTGPLVFGGVVAGWALDRFDRRQVMILDCVVRGIAVGSVPLLHALGALELWHIHAAAGVYSFFMMVVLAGAPTLIAGMVPASQLTAANALETLSYTVGGVIGPAAAGLLIASIGAPGAVLIDMVSYFLFAAMLAGISMPRPDAKSRMPAESGGYAATLRLLGGNAVLLSTTLMFAAFNVGAGAMNVWLPILSAEHLGGDARLFGMLLACMALGETLSTLWAGAMREGRLGLRICVAQGLSGLSIAAILLSPSVAVTALALLMLGACSAPLTIWAQTLRMRILPAVLHGRAFALLRLIMQSGNPVGGALGGATLAALGLLPSIALSALIAGIPGLLGLGVAKLRRAGGPEHP